MKALGVTSTMDTDIALLKQLHEHCDASTGRDKNQPYRKVKAPRGGITIKTVTKFLENKGRCFIAHRRKSSDLRREVKGGMRLSAENHKETTQMLNLYTQTQY